MKRLNDFNKKELLALSDKEIDVLIDYECALQGVPLLPPSPEMPVLEKPEPDTLIYTVGGIHTVSFADAQAALKALLEVKRVEKNYQSSNAYVIAEPSDYYTPKIETEKVFSTALWAEVKDASDKYRRAKDSYDADKRLYDKGNDARKSVEKEVWTAINEAREDERDREKYKALFERYMVLSNQDVSVAYSFLVEAYPDVLEMNDLIRELREGN